MSMKKRITILIPTYNEQAVLPELFQRLNQLTQKTDKYQFEFLFVDDGSRDATRQLLREQAARDPRISYLALSRNFGKEISMTAGIDHVHSDALVIIDADLQDPPELIPQMIHYWEQGFDDVYARRQSRRGETWLKKKTSRWYYKLLQTTTSIPIQVDTGDFRLLDRRCIEALQQFRESQRNTKALFSWIGYKKKEIYYHRDSRLAGSTKWNYRQLINLAIDGITSFTTAPLRIAAILGFIISLVAFLWIVYLLVRPLFGVPTGAGYSSLMATILFLGGVQLLSLGVIGEYVGRIFLETKRRPLYLIEEHHTATTAKKQS